MQPANISSSELRENIRQVQQQCLHLTQLIDLCEQRSTTSKTMEQKEIVQKHTIVPPSVSTSPHHLPSRRQAATPPPLPRSYPTPPRHMGVVERELLLHQHQTSALRASGPTPSSSFHNTITSPFSSRAEVVPSIVSNQDSVVMTPTLRHEEQQKNNSINNNTATTSSSSLSSSRLHRLQRQQQQVQQQQQQREQEIDPTVIQPNDVLFGRGAFTNNRPGNILFRELVAQAKEAYDEADRATVKKNKAKHDIAMNLIKIVKEEYGGRFWKFVGTGTEDENSTTTNKKSKKKRKNNDATMSSDDDDSTTTKMAKSPTAACMEQLGQDGDKGKQGSTSCWFHIVDDMEAAKKTKQALRDAKKSGAYITLHNRKKDLEVAQQRNQQEQQQFKLYQQEAELKRRKAAAAVLEYQQFYEAAQMMTRGGTSASGISGSTTSPSSVANLLGKRSRFTDEGSTSYELSSVLPPVKQKKRMVTPDGRLPVTPCASVEQDEEGGTISNVDENRRRNHKENGIKQIYNAALKLNGPHISI